MRGGDKHDYLSYGPYWWPDPAKKDGLPFIRRDGEIYPDSRNDATDSIRLHKMAAAVETLALAWHFTREARYADRAALLLKTWFLNPESRMNPHLAYGHPQIKEASRIILLPLLRQGARMTGDPRYQAALALLPGADVAKHRAQLTY